MLSKGFGAQEGSFWKEAPPGQTLPVQVRNFADLAEQLKPAVVNISTTQVVKGARPGFRGLPSPSPLRESGERDPFEEFFERFFGGSGPQRELRRNSLGSGFIINKDGYIVTNNHGVENATDIKVSLSDKEQFDAQVVGRDPKTDVALIKIEVKRGSSGGAARELRQTAGGGVDRRYRQRVRPRQHDDGWDCQRQGADYRCRPI